VGTQYQLTHAGHLSQIRNNLCAGKPLGLQGNFVIKQNLSFPKKLVSLYIGKY
jgi:hypothetical protein